MIEKGKAIGKVLGIYIKDEKGQFSRIEEGYLKKEEGLLGDMASHKEGRQVSLFTAEGWDEILLLDKVGLCTKKFHENIRIRDLDLKEIKVGSLIKIGDAVIEITEIGKGCFPVCSLVREGISCPLTREAIFGKVIKSGGIKIGDSLFKVK